MAENTGDVRLFTTNELKAFRYKCSHKLAIVLTIGAVYLLWMTVTITSKVVRNAAAQDKLLYYGIAVAGFLLVVVLVAMLVRRSQSVNFSRFLKGCIVFDNFEYKLEYVELRMPGPLPMRFLKYPVHLMILGKVLEHSEKPGNVEVGHRMVAAAAEHDPALEAFREAKLADLMKFHETFLAAHPEMLREWRNAEFFHSLLVHFILPLVILVGILSLVLKRCEPPDSQKKDAEMPVAGKLQSLDSVRAGAVPIEEKKDVAPNVDADGQVTAPEPVPQG